MFDKKLKIKLNDKKVELTIEPNMTLAIALSLNGIASVKQGCEQGNCGSCTVIVDGNAVQSCMMLAAQVEGKSVQTYESIEGASKYEPLFNTILDNTDKDCGFCMAGIIMSLEALIRNGNVPNEEEIEDALAGNSCYCSTKVKNPKGILTAIKKIKGTY